MTAASRMVEERVAELCRSLRRLLGDEDPLVARTLHDLALVCDQTGRREISALLWTEARRSLPDPLDEVSVVVDPEDGECPAATRPTAESRSNPVY